MMSGYGVVLIPKSWQLGIWRKEHKTLFAFGPLRLVHYFKIGEWKPKT